MNSNGISSPVDWFARRNVIFITSVAAKFRRKFQILYTLRLAGRNIAKISEVKAGTIDGLVRMTWTFSIRISRGAHDMPQRKHFFPYKYYIEICKIEVCDEGSGIWRLRASLALPLSTLSNTDGISFKSLKIISSISYVLSIRRWVK